MVGRSRHKWAEERDREYIAHSSFLECVPEVFRGSVYRFFWPPSSFVFVELGLVLQLVGVCFEGLGNGRSGGAVTYSGRRVVIDWGSSARKAKSCQDGRKLEP